ncbi:hypothetical protein AAC387_Pa06g2244 [Persea americana]
MHCFNHQEERVALRLNEFGQPIGANGCLLSSFLGIIARDGQKAPINYFDWRKMPMERKMDIWRAVLSKFEIATDEQPRGTKDGMERSKSNAENRALQTMNYTTRTKSFARIREEEAQNRDGQAPDLMEMFRLTHTRRDGQLVDRASEDALQRLNERVSQQLESPERSCARDDIFTQVMGEDRRGQVRTFGLCVTPSNIYGPRVSVAEAREMANALNNGWLPWKKE